ncbi:hypothetical protein H4582DRAFT_2063982 [Lactarius indigo]|nr:hypothetical protein H4582DRAFT_2063982 [Lactarius indigo]
MAGPAKVFDKRKEVLGLKLPVQLNWNVTCFQLKNNHLYADATRRLRQLRTYCACATHFGSAAEARFTFPPPLPSSPLPCPHPATQFVQNWVSRLTPSSSSSSPALAAAPIQAQNGGARGKKGGAQGCVEGERMSTPPPHLLGRPQPSLPHLCGREVNKGTPPFTPPPSPFATPPCGTEGTRKGTAHPLPPSPSMRKGGKRGRATLNTTPLSLGRAPLWHGGDTQGHRAPRTPFPVRAEGRRTGARHPCMHGWGRDAHEGMWEHRTLFSIRAEGRRTGVRRPCMCGWRRDAHEGTPPPAPPCTHGGGTQEHRAPAPSLSHLRGRGGACEQGRGGAAGEAERRRGVLPPHAQGWQEGGMRGHEGSPCTCIHHARPPFLPATVLLRYKD